MMNFNATNESRQSLRASKSRSPERCLHCERILILKERKFCWVCAGNRSAAQKEVV